MGPGTALACFFAGIIVGTLIRDQKYEALYRAQRDRGDRWFSRYLQAAEFMERYGFYLPAEDPPNHYG